jgi:hypothetical protein
MGVAAGPLKQTMPSSRTRRTGLAQASRPPDPARAGLYQRGACRAAEKTRIVTIPPV